MSFQLEDMPEAGRLARAAVALVSACGLGGEETRIPSSSWLTILGRRRQGGKDVGHIRV